MNEDRFEPTTSRPLGHRVVQALTSLDPAAAFLDLVRSRLGPGEWAVEADDGFWWIPGQLRHQVSVARGSDAERPGFCRSDVLVLDEVDNIGEALNLVNYFNQRPFGSSMWFDPARRELHATASVTFTVEKWFNAVIFLESIVYSVAVCENLAPRLAALCDGRVPEEVHSQLGRRTTPDSLVGEWLLPTHAPECATGSWLSSGEHIRLRRTIQEFLRGWGLDEQAGHVNLVYEPTVPSTRQTYVSCDVPTDEGWVRISIEEADHPEFGRGLEVLAVTSIEVGDTPDLVDRPVSSVEAQAAANVLNLAEFDAVPDGVVIGGWTAWRNQLCRSTYILPEVARVLLSLGHPGGGDMRALLCTTSVPHFWAPARLMDGSLTEFEWRHVDDKRWGGVEDNAGLHGTLSDLDSIFEQATGAVEINTLLNEPNDVTDVLWPHQHSAVYAEFGIFNPGGPSVGTIELMINYRLQRAALVVRTRHPFAPRLDLWAHLDQPGLAQLPHMLENAVAGLSWTTLDWFDIRDSRDEIVAAMRRGLVRFGGRSDHAAMAHALRLLASKDDPWKRLTEDELPVGLEPTVTSKAGYWAHVVTSTEIVDSHVAFLRSAWEGAIALMGDDVDSAQSRSDQLREEIYSRRGELPA